MAPPKKNYAPPPLIDSKKSLLTQMEAERNDWIAEKWAIRAAAYKTVDIFCGVTGKNITLQHSNDPASVDEYHTIHVDLTQGQLSYGWVEHELSHILFESDNLAMASFCQNYTAQILAAIKDYNKTNPSSEPLTVSDQTLFRMLYSLGNILEDNRVNSLWRLLYPGSHHRLMERRRFITPKNYPDPNESVVAMAVWLLSGLEVQAQAPMMGVKPVLVTALAAVERCEPHVTYLVLRWMLNKTIDALVALAAGRTPWLPDSGVQVKVMPNSKALDTKEALSPRATGEDPDKTVETTEEGPVEAQLAPALKMAPEDRGSALDRVQALQRFVAMAPITMDAAGMMDFQYGGGAYGDDKTPVVINAQETLAWVANVLDADSVVDILSESKQKMDAMIQKTLTKIHEFESKEDYLKQYLKARIEFTDVSASMVVPSKPLVRADLDLVRKLRASFYKVMGRTRYALQESGNGVDTQALLERMMTGEPLPCFRQEERGRGFRAIILVDRSESMLKEKTLLAERASRILWRALKYPFVDLQVWGFQSNESGKVSITRFDPKADSFRWKDGVVAGRTPIHLAIPLAAHELETTREYSKHMFVVTDGMPNFINSNKIRFNEQTLMGWTRDEVKSARRKGIGVSSVIIGSDVGNDKATFMFGGPSHWKMVPDQTKLMSGLVGVVTQAFSRYLALR